MLLVVRGKGRAKTAALRCLDFACTRCGAAAERLVDAGGLGALFAAFSGRSAAAARARRGADAADAEEARAVSLLAALLTLLPRGARRDRVAAKFVEEEHAKVDRLVELWFKHSGRVAAAEQTLDEEEDAAGDDADSDAEEEAQEARYAARMEAGLYTLQQVALILAQLWCVGHAGVNARAARALALGGGALPHVRAVLREYAGALGDAEGAGAREALQRKLLRLTHELYAENEARTPESASDEEAEDDAGGSPAPQEGAAGEAGAEAGDGAEDAGGAARGGRADGAEGMLSEEEDA